MRYVMLRSDECLSVKPFIETQVSFRTDSVEGSIDTAVLDQVMAKIDFGGIADLPLPALFQKIKSKMKQKQQSREMQRKLKKERLMNHSKFKRDRNNHEIEDKKEQKRLKKQQKRRQRLLKKSKSLLDNNVLKSDPLLNLATDKHCDVRCGNVSQILCFNKNCVKFMDREIELSESENKENIRDGNVLDLDSFIEGVLDGIGGNDNDENEEIDIIEAQHSPMPMPSPNNEENRSDSESVSVSVSQSQSKRKRKNDESEIEYRLIVFSNLDRGEFQITNDGLTQLKGKTRSQQLLLQWTSEVLNFHFFSTELKLYESPFGKYTEHDVVTRFSRSKDGRMWSEVVHDEPDGAIELTYPPSLQRVVDNIGTNTEKTNESNNKDFESLVAYITLENRVMQTRILQLASDLSVSREDMKRFVKQTSEDKIRIVEHQQYLINDNMALQKQVQALKKRVRELELNRSYAHKSHK